jgi:anti-sigma factor RsiW
MYHLNDTILQKLIEGSATANDVQRIRRHVEECRACARRLEEWRDNFSEVEERFPELAIESGPSATVSSDGLVLLPTGEPRRRFELDLTTTLWIGVVFMAILVGYGAVRLGDRQDDLPGVFLGPPVPAAAVPAATVPPPDTTRSVDTATRQAAVPAPTPPRNPPPTAPTTTRTDPPAPAPQVSPNFRSIRLSDAARRLGGKVRRLSGLEPDHVEIGPAFAVPGAQANLDVVRVVYRGSDGSRILLDQQLIPADSSGLRPLDDPTLESGETAFRSGANGLSTATWLDDEGYRISLAARVPTDSLRKLVQLVR